MRAKSTRVIATTLPFILVGMCLLFGLGCEARIESFESNKIFATRFEISEGIEMDQPLEDSEVVLEKLFGTPDDPRWPEFLVGDTTERLLSIEGLKRASGPVSSTEDGSHYGLYREHCIVCHGVAGSGLGPAAGLLNPYPRDFRHGQFKFKSTAKGAKPTREDLRRILKQGIVGTGMPAFHLVKDDELESLIDYVIFLSVRGELERWLLLQAGLELDIEGGERIYDERLQNVDPKAFEKSWQSIEEKAKEIVAEWLAAQPAQIPTLPADFPFVGSQATPDEIANSVVRGKQLFQGKVASCSFCHGNEAKGDGQQNNYDDWTRDWTVLAGLNPKDASELRPMLELGALKPNVIAPRNLQLGAFRGGSAPEDLYRRIVYGIEGTPMPAAPVQPANPQGLTETEVWHIVNFLLSFKGSPENHSGADE